MLELKLTGLLEIPRAMLLPLSDSKSHFRQSDTEKHGCLTNVMSDACALPGRDQARWSSSI